jgi:hypothetical protein
VCWSRRFAVDEYEWEGEGDEIRKPLFSNLLSLLLRMIAHVTLILLMQHSPHTLMEESIL